MRNSTRRILVSLHMDSPAGRRQLAGIFRYVASGVNWDFRFSPSSRVPEAEYSSHKPSAGCAGIISSRGLSIDAIRDMVVGQGIPIVMIDVDKAHIATDTIRAGFVCSDDYRAGREGARHLLSLGRMRSYAFLPGTTPSSRWSMLRQRGLADTLRQQGLALNVFDASTDTLDAWLSALPKPAAVMAAADEGANQAMTICHNLKIAIPNQLVIIGNDDDALICENLRPRLSSVRIDHEGEGFAAAKMLDRMMRRPNSPVKDVLLPPKGVAVRESTRPVSPASSLIDRALAYIHEHAAEGISVDDVADHVNASRRLLYLRFGEVLGKTVLAAITEQRISMLKSKLKSSSIPVAKLALDCGFSTAGHANRVFKASEGMSMRDWRRNPRA